MEQRPYKTADESRGLRRTFRRLSPCQPARPRSPVILNRTIAFLFGRKQRNRLLVQPTPSLSNAQSFP